MFCLVHLLGQLVDVGFTVAKVTALDEVVGDLLPAATWAGQLDRVQTVVGLLEVWSDGVDLVDQVLDAGDSQVSDALLDHLVVGDLESLAVDLDCTTLVDQLLHGVDGWVAPGDEWIADSKHLDAGLVQANKHAVSNLSESKKLERLLWLWAQLVDTTDSDDHGQLGLIWDVEVASLLSSGRLVDQCLSFGGVLSGVGTCLLDALSSGDEVVLLGDGLFFLLLGSLLGETCTFLR